MDVEIKYFLQIVTVSCNYPNGSYYGTRIMWNRTRGSAKLES